MCRSDPACRQQNLEGTREILPARVVFMGPSFGGKTAGGVTEVGLGLSVKIGLREMSTSLFFSMVKGGHVSCLKAINRYSLWSSFDFQGEVFVTFADDPKWAVIGALEGVFVRVFPYINILYRSQSRGHIRGSISVEFWIRWLDGVHGLLKISQKRYIRCGCTCVTWLEKLARYT